MLIYEYRIPIPLTKDEYHIGQLYATIQASLDETGGGEGVKIEKNEPYEYGQYTRKVYFLKTKVPKFIQVLAPSGSLELLEESWNTFPSGRTVVTNPKYMKEDFYINIDTYVKEGHVPKNSSRRRNVFRLKPHELSLRKIIHIDIANDHVKKEDYVKEEDPKLFATTKAAVPRGPLRGDWISSTEPMLTVYKLVRCKFKWWGLQQRVEKAVMDGDVRLFDVFHRKIFCWLDRYCDMTIEDIRWFEREAKNSLEEQRKGGKVRGTVTANDT